MGSPDTLPLPEFRAVRRGWTTEEPPLRGLGGCRINAYEIMIIFNPEAGGERHEDIVERVRKLITDGQGEIKHVNDWGERKIAFPINGQGNGRYLVLTCEAQPDSLNEIDRVLAINKDVVLRSQQIRLSRAQAAHQIANGAPPPVDDRPEGEPFPRPGRPQRRRGR